MSEIFNSLDKILKGLGMEKIPYPTKEEINKILAEDMENYEKYLASEDYKDYFNSPVSNLDISEELIKQLKLFQQYHSVKKIYYPCCATDVSVSKAFNNCKIIYADLNKFAIDLLRIYP